MLRTEAIQKFLQDNPYPIGHLYNENMEVQVTVDRGKGEPYSNNYKGTITRGFTDGVIRWKPFRIPWNADIEPKYDKSLNITFPIDKHASHIGMSGWDWFNKKSLWVGYDFDSIIGHKEGLTGDEIQNITDKVKQVPWVTLISSTSGIGFHIYVFISNSPIVSTHTEHAALARAILGKLSIETGLQLEASVDTMGTILWCWATRAIPGKSFRLIKKGTSLDKVPDNWQEYIKTVSRRELTAIKQTDKDTMIAAQTQHALDEQHILLIKYLEDKGCFAWWNADKNMLVCHTFDLMLAHRELKFKGFFNTIAEGKTKDDQNCFCFPIRNGAWVVHRHTRGATEHVTWNINKSGWTTTYLNKSPNLRAASKFTGGIEGEKDYSFATLTKAIDTLIFMGFEVEPPTNLGGRTSTIRQSEDKIILSFARLGNDPDTLEDWIKRKHEWQKIFYREQIVDEVELPDNTARFLTSMGEGIGWFVQTNKGWVSSNRQSINAVLLSTGYKRQEIEMIAGKCILNNWTQICRPFRPEYLGDREWNRNAPQFRFNPEKGIHPHWDKVLMHLGTNLDTKENKWCMDYGINTGSLYIMAWIVSLFQCPEEPLPFLVFSGQQNTGKSIFHEALSLLVTHGVVRADYALTNPQFNGELFGAFLCVVEETNLSKYGGTGEKIKDWVTGKTISIHKKGVTPFDIPNFTHWVQCTNDPSYCPILPGDTRIVITDVPTLKEEIPKTIFLERLEKEAPAFINSIFSFDLPNSDGRLRIPVIETTEKRIQQSINRSPLDQFISEEMYTSPGCMELFSELTTRFEDWLGPADAQNWTNIKISKEMQRLKLVKGKHGIKGKVYIGNYSFDQTSSGNNRPLIVSKTGRLMEEY